MRIATTGGCGAALPLNAPSEESVPKTAAVARDVEEFDIAHAPVSAEHHRSADRAIGDRLRRSLAAPSTAEPVKIALPAAQASTSPARPDELERRAIDSALREWIDLDKATLYSESPSQLLRAISDYDHRPIPPEFELTLDLALLEDERVIDAAAVLYHQLRRGTPSGEIASGATVPLATLRSEFVAALREDYARRRALDALAAVAAPSGKTGQKGPYFDGFAIRNAQHKTFDELVALPNLSADPAFAALSMEDKRHLLEKKFAQMAESTAYVIGTPEHSLATALLRLQSARGEPVSTRFSTPAALLKAFQQAEKDWAAKPFYPYHPRLLFAAHLARTDGIELLSPDDLMLVYENRVHDRALEAFEKNDKEPIAWITRFLSKYEIKGASWKTQSAHARTQIIMSLFAALREAADGHEPIAGFARELRDSGVLSENRLIGDDRKARWDALIAYGNERLLAVFGAAPRFDRRDAAAAILRENGLADDDIEAQRHYVIAGDNPHLSKDDYGDRIDEFLDRADWSGLVGSRMTLAPGVQIAPRDELQKAEERFNAGLRTDSWVVARARENLWARGVRPTPEALSEEVERIAHGLQTETESHRAWVRGAETWVNTVPVAGPVYNIEEGVRHHDAVRAAFGALFLGLDLFDLGAGAGGRAGVARGTHPAVARMGRAAERLDASMVELATHPTMVEAAADQVDIAVQDGDIPLVHRGLARRVRDGDEHVRWRDYAVVHLEHSNRIVPVAKEGQTYREVSWHSGRRLATNAALERDPLSGKLRPSGYRVERFEDGLTTIRGSSAETRLTVKRVKDIVKAADSLELRDFDGIFEAHFDYRSAGAQASTFDFKTFCRTLYGRSPTFRRLVNRFEDLHGRAGNDTRNASRKWEMLVGEVGPLGAPTKAYTDFEHKRIYMPRDETIEAMEYMTASGLRPISREQIYLHEMVHALTGARDPERMLDMLNRGPVVYLTDKILSEGGYTLAEQVMYRRQNSAADTEPHQSIEYHRDAAARAAHAENLHLDSLFDGKPRSVPANRLVEGAPVESRITVREAKQIVLDVAMVEDDVFLSMGDFERKLAQNFGFFAGESAAVDVAASDAKVLADFYRRLYGTSPTFRYLFDRMPAVDSFADEAIWRFMLDGRPPLDATAQGASRQSALRAKNEIYLLDGDLRYLSSVGVRDVEFERKMTYDMVRAMGGFKPLAPGETYRNRGAAVYLTDVILSEAGFHYPKQVAAALVSAGDRIAEGRLAAYQTSAQRSAAIEDRYLSQS